MLTSGQVLVKLSMDDVYPVNLRLSLTVSYQLGLTRVTLLEFAKIESGKWAGDILFSKSSI